MEDIVFDPKSPDVFLNLEYLNGQQMDFGELLNTIKNEVSDNGNDSNFVAIYAHRVKDSCAVVVRFRRLPVFSPDVSSNIQTSVMLKSDLVALSKKQLYTVNDRGRPALAYISSEYGIEYFFNPRSSKQFPGVSVLNVYQPVEHVASLDFTFRNAIFRADGDSIMGETFYVFDEWSRDVRAAIIEEADITFSSADGFPEIKGFRDYTLNDMVLFKHSGIVRRGCVLSCINNVCEVFSVDEGIKLRCASSQLRVCTPNLAYIRFLAIPCVLNGITQSASPKLRADILELINQLDRSKTELVVYGKDEKGFQHVDVLFTDENSGVRMNVSKYLQNAGMIKTIEPPVSPTCTYSFTELLDLVVNARRIDLPVEKAGQILRPWTDPRDFLMSNAALTQRMNINF